MRFNLALWGKDKKSYRFVSYSNLFNYFSKVSVQF